MPIPKFVVTAALFAANMALTMTRKIEGPRLDDLKFTGGDYGASLPLVWGKRRLQVPIFWAENLKEVQRRRKTKGGKFNEFTYFGTWAVALCGHEIAQVTRIWFDTHLVYDVTGGGPVTPFDFGGSGSISDFIAIYLGTEDQQADPRMLATVEGLHGEGSCPAYRGTAYICFKDIPLEKLGNRIPQCSVEFVTEAAPVFPWETNATPAGSAVNIPNWSYSAGYARFIWAGVSAFEIWDTAARTRLYGGTLPRNINVGSKLGLKPNGEFLAISAGNDHLLKFSADGTSVTTVQTFGSSTHDQQEVRVLVDGNGIEHWATIPYSVLRRFWFNGAEFRMDEITPADWAPAAWLVDSYGDIWAIGRTPGVGKTVCHFYRMVYVSGRGGSGYFSATGLDATNAQIPDIGGVHSGDRFVIQWEHNDLYAIEEDTGTVLHHKNYGGLSTRIDTVFENFPAGTGQIWITGGFGGEDGEVIREISLTDLSTIRTINIFDWKLENIGTAIYDPINHALIAAPPASNVLTWRFLDRFDNDGVTLGQIVGDVADMVGVEEHDFTALNQIIPGWSATHGQASNICEPLLDAYDSDIRPHDFEIEGIKRTGISGGTLLTPNFVAAEPRYSVRIKQASELPGATIINVADINADQQPFSHRSDRPLDASGARGELVLDMTTLAIDADTARNLADRHLRRLWNSRREVSLSLTAKELKLEPGDVRTITLDDKASIYRCVSLTIRADGVLATDWKYDHPSLAVLDSAQGANFDGRGVSGNVIQVPLLSEGFVLDIPFIQDADNRPNPVVYIAAAPAAEGLWPGATVFQEVDGEYTEATGSIGADNAVVWGKATNALADANPWIWDRGNSVNVTVSGDLTGTTEATVNAVPAMNLALLGDEIINFTTATLEEDGSYTLSGLKRGRRGTEWATGTHAANDVFLLLNHAQEEELGLSEVGTDLSFKTITEGRSEDGAPQTDLTPFTGASFKPYAPAHLEATRDPDSGDWTLEWVRRTRIGGAWTSGTTIPLSEASEEYEVEILDGAAVVRTITGLTSPTTIYTAEMADEDFGSPPPDELDWRVFQISDAVGRGFAAAA
jgi:hypothetical protein